MLVWLRYERVWPMNSTDRSSQGRIFSQKLSLTGTRRKCESGMKSGLGQVLLALSTYTISFCSISSCGTDIIKTTNNYTPEVLPWQLNTCCRGNWIHAAVATEYMLPWQLNKCCRGNWINAAVATEYMLPWQLNKCCRGNWINAVVATEYMLPCQLNKCCRGNWINAAVATEYMLPCQLNKCCRGNWIHAAVATK